MPGDLYHADNFDLASTSFQAVAKDGTPVFSIRMGESRRAFCGCIVTASRAGLSLRRCPYHVAHPFDGFATTRAEGKDCRRWARIRRRDPERLRSPVYAVQFTVGGVPGRKWRLPR